MAKWSLGLDIGSVAIKLALFNSGKLETTNYKFHYGDILGCLRTILSPWSDLEAQVAITGKGARNFPEELQVDEVVAAIEGTKWVLGQNFYSLLVIGGEKIRLIELDQEGFYRRHLTNSDCASGTGSFLEQQAARLGLSLQEFEELAYKYQGEIPSIATRCAVLARTDLIHRQQEGYSLASLAAGLSRGMARVIVDAVIKGGKIESPLYVAGGGSIHRRLLSFLAEILRIEVKPVPSGELVTAFGAARLASIERNLRELLSIRTKINYFQLPLNPPLKLAKSKLPDLSQIETWEEEGIEINLFKLPQVGSIIKGYLGLDIGSTSTKLVLMDETRSLILGLYTRTAAAPVVAVQRLFRWLDQFGQKRDLAWYWLGVATTGSGRTLIGQLIGADLIINEITAQARAAVHHLPEVDTIIEIGGQDSKFIRLQDGAVVQSLMNTICAAGTGAFLEEQAQKLGVPLHAYDELIRGFSGPAISDRCTVYMERDLSRLLAEGWSKEELLASALHSVRDNYLIRLVGQTKIGEKISFQGATARNRGLVAAFEVALNKTIYVPPYPHLAGAYGASLLVKELKIEKTQFTGLRFGHQPIEQWIEICEVCPNSCRLTVVKVGQSLAIWGSQCGREYEEKRRKRPARSISFINNVSPDLEHSKKDSLKQKKAGSIGLPNVLPLSEMELFWWHFFHQLGFALVLPGNEEELLVRGQNLARAEFCAPVYLGHGQVEKLFSADCDFIFFPIMLEGPDRGKISAWPRFYCYYTVYLPIILRETFALGQKKLLSPMINFRWPDQRNIVSLQNVLEKKLGLPRKEIAAAWKEAKAAWEKERQKKIEQNEAFLKSLKEKEWAIVLLGRPYNLNSPLLSQNLPEVIESYGVKVLRAEQLAFRQENQGEGNFLHWYYGQMIMSAARRVVEDDRLFPVFITNFRCSPDSFILTYFRDLMERAHKPYLILQLDGLNSDIGYRTRIEAALESFRHWRPKKKEKSFRVYFIPLQKNKYWIVPHVDNTASILAVATLERFGYEALLAHENQKTIHRGL
ncbi:MAG: acyl-CoA dehydratase activase, partial [Candidatus Aminicenantes bacterium]|nr:acyl-CoA dehydratase activase [Candidatus Aminicenantes bacterium]